MMRNGEQRPWYVETTRRSFPTASNWFEHPSRDYDVTTTAGHGTRGRMRGGSMHAGNRQFWPMRTNPEGPLR